jgi:hypothetical protein
VYFERERGTLAGTLAELTKQPTGENERELVGITEGDMELARGIEPPTCGLQKCEHGYARAHRHKELCFNQWHDMPNHVIITHPRTPGAP